MPIVPLHGHQALRERLLDSLRDGSFPSSLLLHGPRGVGKQRLALWLGQAILCEAAERPCGVCQHCRYALELGHPDLHWFFPRARLDADADIADVDRDYIDAMTERRASNVFYPPSEGTAGIFVYIVNAIVHRAAMSPAMARGKVFIIGDAERMVAQEGSEFAANALLKLLEEPPADTTIVLTTSEPGALLPTIRSRVVSVRVPLLTTGDVERFLSEPAVIEALRADKSSREAKVAAAGGAPGRLFGSDARAAASEAARHVLDAALTGDRAAQMKVALAQGSSKARGGFSEMLDALIVLLHAQARQAVMRQDDRTATGAARGVALVQSAREKAFGNVSPNLITASLLRDLSGALR